MVTTLNSRIQAIMSWDYRNVIDNSSTKDISRITRDLSLTDGTASGQADIMWHDRRLVAPATTIDDLDLAGSLVDVFGNTITFVNMKMVYVRVLGDPSGTTWVEQSASRLRIGGAGAGGNAWGGMFNGDQDAVFELGDGDVFFWCNKLNGETVTAGTGDILRIAHAAGTFEIEFDIVLVGTTA